MGTLLCSSTLRGFGFGVEVLDGRHPDTSSGDAKGGVLNYLELFYGCRADIWKPDWSCISEKITDQGVEGF